MQEMPEIWVRLLDWVDPLEEGMATHSSILAWRIPKDRGAWRAAELDTAEATEHYNSPNSSPSSRLSKGSLKTR